MYHRYLVKYRRDVSGRVYRAVVTARDPDEARDLARIKDPRMIATTTTPRKGPMMIVATGELNK